MQSNQLIQYTEQYGGSGGEQFSDPVVSYKMELRKVLIRSGVMVDSIQLMLGNGTQEQWLQKHGGQGGSQHAWQVPYGQHIKYVEIFSGLQVDSITFVTNDGIRSPKFGGNGGTQHIIAIPDGYGIVGARGSCGASLDRLGFITERLQFMQKPYYEQGYSEIQTAQQDYNQYQQGFNPNFVQYEQPQHHHHYQN